MTRLRLATVLAFVATVAVLGSGIVAAAAYLRQDDATPLAGDAAPDPVTSALVVRDSRSGARFEVPGDSGWRVKDRRVRIYYADSGGRPTAVVHGPAVFREGYCPTRPRDSNRAFAGFTREPFATWAGALARSDGGESGWGTGVDRRRLELADGTPARLTRAGLFVPGRGPCTASGVEVAMVEAGQVRVVLVRDTGDPGTLPADDVESILTSLRLK